MTKAKLKEYKVPPDELLDLIDAAAVGEFHAVTKRCPGGRLIADGYVCIHCGHDPSILYDEKGQEVYRREPGQKTYRKCGAPARKVLATENLIDLIPTRIEG